MIKFLIYSITIILRSVNLKLQLITYDSYQNLQLEKRAKEPAKKCFYFFTGLSKNPRFFQALLV